LRESTLTFNSAADAAEVTAIGEMTTQVPSANPTEIFPIMIFPPNFPGRAAAELFDGPSLSNRRGAAYMGRAAGAIRGLEYIGAAGVYAHEARGVNP
jgi:hypothetical protein